MSCPHNFLPQGGKYPLCGIDGGICFGPDHHRWDACPVYFGPWGAWRAALGDVYDLAESTDATGRRPLWMIDRAIRALLAVGWSL